MRVMSFILLLIIFFMLYVIFFLYRAFEQKCIQYDKVMRNFLMLYDWMEEKQKDSEILVSFLQERGYGEILVYGWGYLGRLLCKELEHTQIKVKGIIYRRHLSDTYGIPSYRSQDALPKVDAVVLTVLYDGERIMDDIKMNMDCPIISLEEFV